MTGKWTAWILYANGFRCTNAFVNTTVESYKLNCKRLASVCVCISITTSDSQRRSRSNQKTRRVCVWNGSQANRWRDSESSATKTDTKKSKWQKRCVCISLILPTTHTHTHPTEGLLGATHTCYWGTFAWQKNKTCTSDFKRFVQSTFGQIHDAVKARTFLKMLNIFETGSNDLKWSRFYWNTEGDKIPSGGYASLWLREGSKLVAVATGGQNLSLFV